MAVERGSEGVRDRETYIVFGEMEGEGERARTREREREGERWRERESAREREGVRETGRARETYRVFTRALRPPSSMHCFRSGCAH